MPNSRCLPLKLFHGDNTASRANEEWGEITNSACGLRMPANAYAAFNLIYVLVSSVLTQTSPSCAVRSNIFCSVSTTKVCPIARGGRIEFGNFPFASNPANQFASFLVSSRTNCGADAFGPRTSCSPTVNTWSTVSLPPTCNAQSTFKSSSISTECWKFTGFV